MRYCTRMTYMSFKRPLQYLSKSLKNICFGCAHQIFLYNEHFWKLEKKQYLRGSTFAHRKNMNKIFFLYRFDSESEGQTLLDILKLITPYFLSRHVLIIEGAAITLLKMDNFPYLRGWEKYGAMEYGKN